MTADLSSLILWSFGGPFPMGLHQLRQLDAELGEMPPPEPVSWSRLTVRHSLRGGARRANLDATFAALWANPERNIAEAERDRRTDAEIDAGAGFRGSIDDLLLAVDG